MAIQTDGRIVAAGGVQRGETKLDFTLVRYLSNGRLDRRFGRQGRVVTDFNGRIDRLEAVVIQPDGKILAVGITAVETRFGFALARYLSDGSLDPGFGSGGKTITRFSANAVAFEAALQDDGKILVGGGVFGDFALARYNPDGTLDPGFSSDGKKLTDLGGDDLIYGGVLVQDNGKIVALGYSEGSSFTYYFALARFNPDGTVDGTFGELGRQETDLGDGDFIHSAAVQSDGKIIAGGEICPGGSRPCDPALARYEEDGALDPSFGDGGVAGTAFPTGGGPHAGMGVSIQNDGRIVLAGQVWNGTDLDFGLARFEPDGDLDETFGNGGRVLTDFAGGRDVVWGSAIQADDKVVAAGGSGGRIAMARYLPA